MEQVCERSPRGFCDCPVGIGGFKGETCQFFEFWKVVLDDGGTEMVPEEDAGILFFDFGFSAQSEGGEEGNQKKSEDVSQKGVLIYFH